MVYRSGGPVDSAQSRGSRNYLVGAPVYECIFRPLFERHRSRICGWNERPIFAALCATGLAALSAKAGTLDAPREAIHGISAPRDTALPALRARRATRPRGRDLGELFSALREYRVLDERRIRR